MKLTRLLLIFPLLAACQHKSDMPVPLPVTVSKQDSVQVISAPPFVPYTDTFTGTFRQAEYWIDGSLTAEMTDNSFLFLIIHLDTNKIEIRSAKQLYVDDTFQTNSDDYYLSGFNPLLNDKKGYTWQVGVDTFRITDSHGTNPAKLYFNRETESSHCSDSYPFYMSFVGTKK